MCFNDAYYDTGIHDRLLFTIVTVEKCMKAPRKYKMKLYQNDSCISQFEVIVFDLFIYLFRSRFIPQSGAIIFFYFSPLFDLFRDMRLIISCNVSYSGKSFAVSIKHLRTIFPTFLFISQEHNINAWYIGLRCSKY